MSTKKSFPIQDLMLKCKELKSLFPYNQKGVRNSLSCYNEAWQDALSRIETELQALLEREKKEIHNAAIFGMNMKGAGDADAKEYVKNYYLTTEEFFEEKINQLF
jgi:hypothetical protein